jgi:uncharacterized damage-inducible protein DinB
MKTVFALVFCFAVAASAQTPAPAPKPAPPAPTIASINDREVGIVEREFVSAAEAMPEDKYNYVPTDGEFKGVRTFAKQVKHVAVSNYRIWSAAVGEKPAVDVSNDEGPDSIRTKADILKFLKDSFALGHRAARMLTPENSVDLLAFGDGKSARLFWVSFGVAHAFDHYGQMAVYLRMNGIVPPASRQGS